MAHQVCCPNCCRGCCAPPSGVQTCSSPSFFTCCGGRSPGCGGAMRRWVAWEAVGGAATSDRQQRGLAMYAAPLPPSLPSLSTFCLSGSRTAAHEQGGSRDDARVGGASAMRRRHLFALLGAPQLRVRSRLLRPRLCCDHVCCCDHGCWCDHGCCDHGCCDHGSCCDHGCSLAALGGVAGRSMSTFECRVAQKNIKQRVRKK